MLKNISTPDLIRDYQDGLTLAEVATKHGCSLHCVYRRLVKARVSLRRVGAPEGVRDARRLRELRALRARGMTYKEIAKKYGVSRQAVAQMIEYHA